MKKSISIKQLAHILKEGTAPVDPAATDPAAAPVDPAAAAPAAPAVDPAIVDLVTQLATACGLTVTPPADAAAAAPAEAPADPAAAQAVAERRARLRRLREARIARRRALRK